MSNRSLKRQSVQNASHSGKILISRGKIARRVRELSRDIRAHYKKEMPVLLGLMDGALFFLTDLLRELPPTCEVRCIPVKSYRGTSTSGKITGLAGLGSAFKGRDVLIVDDVLDTGLTLAAVKQRLLALGARRVEICVLVSKRKVRDRAVRARWIGFEIDDHFIIGYGLDYDGLYRGLPDVRILTLNP